jgi:hypothetical protein
MVDSDSLVAVLRVIERSLERIDVLELQLLMLNRHADPDDSVRDFPSNHDKSSLML